MRWPDGVWPSWRTPGGRRKSRGVVLDVVGYTWPYIIVAVVVPLLCIAGRAR